MIVMEMEDVKMDFVYVEWGILVQTVVFEIVLMLAIIMVFV